MPTSKEYFEYVFSQLSGLNDVSYRKMMGEYILYYKGKVVGGIYDDRLLLKPAESAENLIGSPVYELPYVGAKNMLLVENIDDKEFLEKLIKTVYNDLSAKNYNKSSVN